MNIFCIFPEFDRMQINKDPGQISLWLAKLNNTVKILTYEVDKDCDLENVEIVAKKKFIPLPYFFPKLQLLWFILRHRNSVDCIVYWHYFVNTAFSCLLTKVISRNIINVVKMDTDGDLYFGSPITRFLKRIGGEFVFRILAKYADLFIVETPEAKQRILRYHPYLAKKLIFLPNGINVYALHSSIKNLATKKKKKILFVGKIEKQKGLDILINAFEKISWKYPEWSLELVGNVNKKFLKKVFKKLDIQVRKRIKICGPLYNKALAKKYLSAEIFCLPSYKESFGFVLLEASFFKLPVVSSNVGVAKYLLRDNSFIFKIGDKEDLIRKLELFINNPVLRRRIGYINHKRCLKYFNWEQIVRKLDKYLRCLRDIPESQ